MKMKKQVAGLIGTIMLGSLFAMSVYTAYEYFFVIGRDATTGLYPTVTVFNFTWLKFTDLLTFNIGFRLTPISVMMLIVITTVSFMVHIYSFGYMAERDEHYKFEEYEHGFQRFYAYLSLFTMSMFGLSCSYKHLPNVYVLGACGCMLLLVNWILLSQTYSRTCLEEGFHRYTFCRLIFPHRYFVLQFLCRHIQL